MTASLARSVLAEVKRVCSAHMFTDQAPLYISLQESPERSNARQDMTSVKRYIETVLNDNEWTSVQCKVNRQRVEVKSAIKGGLTITMTAAGIGRAGQAFCYPNFALKIGVPLQDMDAELRCLLR